MHKIHWILLCLLLSACASLRGPQTITLSQQQLNTSLEQRLNKSLSFLSLFDISLTNPKIILDPAHKRLVTQLDAAMRNPFSGNHLNGKATISGRVEIDAATRTIRLRDPKTEEFALEGLPPQYAAQVNAVGQMIAADFLKELTLYQIKPEELTIHNVKYQPNTIEVKTGQLLITLKPQ